jgi:hypothetical protein
LTAFEAGLAAASQLMPFWRREEVEAVWIACDQGLRRSSSSSAKAQQTSPPAGFEGLLGLVQGLLDPLEPFAAAEARFVALRRRGRKD